MAIDDPRRQTGHRIVQIYIIDPDENIRVDHRLVYKGEEEFTDATDEELLFGLDMNEILGGHNAYREAHDLEPIRLRDLVLRIRKLVTF
jgi:hypothetical protein